MDRSQNLGFILMGVAAFQTLVLTLGVLRRSYFAVALPVLAVTSAISGLLFWIGYTMVNMEEDMAELDIDEEEELPASA